MKQMKLVAHLASLTVVLATGMLPSIASAQLGALGPSVPAIPGVAALGSAVAYDPVHNVSLVVSAHGAVNGQFIDGSETGSVERFR